MEKIIQRDILPPIEERIKQMDIDWKRLYKSHFLQALKLYKLGESENIEFFRDCINRCNKIFEGVLKKLYETLLIIDTSLRPLSNRKRMAGKLIQIFKNDRLFPEYFRLKLDDYRIKIRNDETHEVFNSFDKEDAKESLHYTIVFLFLAYSTDVALRKSDKLENKDIIIILTSAFIESFKIFSQQFLLYHRDGPYIYPDKKEELLSLVEEYYDISPFKTYFTLEKRPSMERKKPDFKLTFEDCELLIIIQKIGEYEMIHYRGFFDKLKNKLVNYYNDGHKIFLTYWCFTSRYKNKNLDILPNLDIPIQIIDSLESSEQKKIDTMDFI